MNAIHNTYPTALRKRIVSSILLAVYICFMVVTNHRLTILDDEATIITVANTPVGDMIQAFTSGLGQHEHPPLSDILLHDWLIATHHSFAWMRVFAIIWYVAGLLVLARCGEEIGGRHTWWAILLVGTLWPFGYFYARITGWYCFCFFLVGLLTYAYLRLLREPSVLRWGMFTAIAILLLWSNYFGLAVLLLLLADLVLTQPTLVRKNIPILLVSMVLIALSFLPLLHALLYDANGTVKPAGISLPSLLFKFGYMCFALLASVAVAPWFLPWSIPIAIAGLILLALVLMNAASRRFALLFLAALFLLALSNHLDLKRLLFLTPWMMLALGLACSNLRKPQESVTVTASSIVIAGIGWFAIATGSHRATNNFYEPWKDIAVETAAQARQGDVIISDSTTYFFYLNRALGLADIAAHQTYLGQAAYSTRSTTVFRDSFATPPHGTIVVVTGIAVKEEMNAFSATVDRLRQSCKLMDHRQMTPDPAADFKSLVGPTIPILAYRAEVDTFQCP